MLEAESFTFSSLLQAFGWSSMQFTAAEELTWELWKKTTTNKTFSPEKNKKLFLVFFEFYDIINLDEKIL